MEKLTNSEREEAENLSKALVGSRSAWKSMVRNGVVEKVLDENGDQVLHKGIPMSRTVRKTEREVLETLRDLNEKKIAIEKERAAAFEKAKQERELKNQLSEASGKTGRGVIA